MRAVLDTNVIVSALMFPEATPGRVMRLWSEGAYDLVSSPHQLRELQRVLEYPRVQRGIAPGMDTALLELIKKSGGLMADPVAPPNIRSSDPDDDYLIALASSVRAVLVSGDRDLLALAGKIPVYSPADFLILLGH